MATSGLAFALPHGPINQDISALVSWSVTLPTEPITDTNCLLAYLVCWLQIVSLSWKNWVQLLSLTHKKNMGLERDIKITLCHTYIFPG